MIYLILLLNRNRLSNNSVSKLLYKYEHNYNNNKVENYTLDNVIAWYKKCLYVLWN